MSVGVCVMGAYVGGNRCGVTVFTACLTSQTTLKLETVEIKAEGQGGCRPSECGCG